MGNCKRRVRCTLCTKYRWLGNTKNRRPAKEQAKRTTMKKDIKEN